MRRFAMTFGLLIAGACISTAFTSETRENTDSDRGKLQTTLGHTVEKDDPFFSRPNPPVYLRSAITREEATKEFPLVAGMNAQRFVHFVERVDRTMVTYGNGGIYYDIVPEHLFIDLADGLLVVRMTPRSGFDPRKDQPLKGKSRKCGIDRMVIDAYFLDSNMSVPADYDAWIPL